MSVRGNWRRLLTLLSGLGGVFGACSEETAFSQADLVSAEQLAFRCESDAGGLPIDGCGCTRRVFDAEGHESLHRMGRVECDCVWLDPKTGGLYDVDYVAANTEACEPVMKDGCVVDWDCPALYDEETGDFVPASAPPKSNSKSADCAAGPAKPQAIRCIEARDGVVRGYVGSSQRGELAVLDLEGGSREVLDIDESIPGITAIYTGDVVSAVETHSHGLFTFAVLSGSGRLALIDDAFEVRPGLYLDLDYGPLFDAVVWPPVERSKPDLSQPSRAYVGALDEHALLEIDLDLAGQILTCTLRPYEKTCVNFDPEAAKEDVILQVLPLIAAEDGGIEPKPGALAISDDGHYLFAAHHQEAALTSFDLWEGTAKRIELGRLEICEDGWRTRLLEFAKDDRSCEDGLDNNGDGAIDADDESCRLWGTESPNPQCIELSECADGADNDGDGLIDAEDDDCKPENCSGDCDLAVFLAFEGPVPACSDGKDNDGDGWIDRDDTGCVNERDDDELDEVERSTCADGEDNDEDGLIDWADPDCRVNLGGRLIPEEGIENDLCTDGLDNDGDGLIDSDDPGCSDHFAIERFADFEVWPACSDGLDNDGDGKTDYPEDPGCYAASDRTEQDRASYGPGQLQTVRAILDGVAYDFLYILTSSGELHYIDLNPEGWPVRRLNLDAPVLSMTARQMGAEASLLVVAYDGTLRSVQVTAPVQLTTADGAPVFARINSDANRILGYYAVADGFAWKLPDCEFPETRAIDLDALPLELPFENPVLSYALPPLEERVPFDVVQNDYRNYGAYDPPVYVAGAHQFLQAELNTAQSALRQQTHVYENPILRVRGSVKQIDPSRFPVFCRLPQPTEEQAQGEPACASNAEEPLTEKQASEEAEPQEGEGASGEGEEIAVEEDPVCIPEGFDESGRGESKAAFQQRNSYRVSEYSAIQVIETDPRKVPAGEYSIAYEGELPNSFSKTGQFASREDDDHWAMLDYDADFCELGVEPGDVLLVEVFLPKNNKAALQPACKALERKNSDPNQYREPRRYRIADVSAHRLSLEREERQSYDPQLPERDSGRLPQLFSAPDAPLYDCAAQGIRYRIRAGNDQWLLTGEYSGYRHPWRNRAGQCEIDQSRLKAGRVGRVKLGQVFENEWFRFHLGSLKAENCPKCQAQTAVPQSAEPHLVDDVFTFKVQSGAQYRRLGLSVLSPQQMRWLPADDHLYVVDSG